MNGKEFLRERYGLLDNLVKLIGKELVEEREGRWDFLCLRYLLNELGKKEAWEYIWHRCEGTVKKAIGFYFKGRKDISKEDKEDVYCLIRCEIYIAIDKYRGRGSLDGFLWTISKRVIKKWLRKRKPLELIEDIGVDEGNAHHSGELWEMIEALRGEIEKLGEKEQKIFKLYNEGYTLKEIADRLDYPPGTVRKCWWSAMQKLKATLRKIFLSG